MIENKFEAVSELLDGHDIDAELIEDIKQDDKLCDSWSRYHLIGDVMRGETADFIDLDLSDEIASAIAAEPTLLVPQPTPSIKERVQAKVVKLVRPVGQFAIAASAAGLMILGVQQGNVVQDEGQIQPTQVFQPLPLGGVADPVSYNYSAQSIPNQKQSMIDHQQRLQAILQDHKKQIKLNNTINLENQTDASVEQDEVNQ